MECKLDNGSLIFRATAKISAIDRIDGEISTELKSLQRLIQKVKCYIHLTNR